MLNYIIMNIFSTGKYLTFNRCRECLQTLLTRCQICGRFFSVSYCSNLAVTSAVMATTTTIIITGIKARNWCFGKTNSSYPLVETEVFPNTMSCRQTLIHWDTVNLTTRTCTKLTHLNYYITSHDTKASIC